MKATCPVCYGGKTIVKTCPVCLGTGRTQRDPLFTDDVKSYKGTATVGICDRCEGWGTVRDKCPTCHGMVSLVVISVGVR